MLYARQLQQNVVDLLFFCFEGYPSQEVLDESCDICGSVICVGSESRCSFLDFSHFVYNVMSSFWWKPQTVNVFEYSKSGLTNAIYRQFV